jgi:hypothetical protein
MNSCLCDACLAGRQVSLRQHDALPRLNDSSENPFCSPLELCGVGNKKIVAHSVTPNFFYWGKPQKNIKFLIQRLLSFSRNDKEKRLLRYSRNDKITVIASRLFLAGWQSVCNTPYFLF